MKEEKLCFCCVFCEPLFLSGTMEEQNKLKKICICHQVGDYVDVDTANKCKYYKEKQLKYIKGEIK